jgi:replication factor A1
MVAAGAVAVGSVVSLTDYTINSLASGLKAVVADLTVAGGAPSADAAAAAVARTPAAATRPGFAATPGPAPPSASALASVRKAAQPIHTLNPYSATWTVRAKVTSKGPLRSTASGTSVFSAELVDANGTPVEATFWREAADRLHPALAVDGIYYFSKGKVKPANKAYSNVRNDYCLDFGPTALVEASADADDAGMQAALAYVTLDKLAARVGKKAPVDVVGLAVAVAALGSVKRKSDDAELARRDVTLADASGRSVTLTLWGATAEGVGAELEAAAAAAAAAGAPPPVLSASSCRVGDYNGVSLSSLGRSALTMEPADGAAADALRAWWAADGSTTTLTPAGEGMAGARGAGGPRARATLASLDPRAKGESLPPPDAKPDYSTVVATFTLVDPEQTLWYAAAPEHNRKVVAKDGGWWCEYDQTLHPTMTRRYVLTAAAADGTGEASLSLFDEAATALLGMTADALASLKDDSPAAAAKVLAAAAWTPYVLRVQSRTQEYNGERRRRLAVHSLAPMDWAGEARRLAADIAALETGGVKAEPVAVA